jgi:hypothetical protein
VNLAAQHFDEPILYDFCRFAAGLRNLVTAEQLQSQVNLRAYGQSPLFFFLTAVGLASRITV